MELVLTVTGGENSNEIDEVGWEQGGNVSASKVAEA